MDNQNQTTSATQDGFEKRIMQTQQKSGKGLKIASAFLALAVVALGGYIAYDKLIVVKTEEQQAIETKNQAEEKQAAKKVKHADGFVVSIDAGNFYITKDGEAYFSPEVDNLRRTAYCQNCNLDFAGNEFLGQKQEFSIAKSDIGGYSLVGDNSKELKFTGYKLGIDNVTSCQEVLIGQTRSSFNLIFISKNGIATLAAIIPGNMDSNNKASFITNQFEGASDITAGIQTNMGDGMSVVLIGADGSHYTIKESDFQSNKESAQ